MARQTLWLIAAEGELTLLVDRRQRPAGDQGQGTARLGVRCGVELASVCANMLTFQHVRLPPWPESAILTLASLRSQARIQPALLLPLASAGCPSRQSLKSTRWSLIGPADDQLRGAQSPNRWIDPIHRIDQLRSTSNWTCRWPGQGWARRSQRMDHCNVH